MNTGSMAPARVLMRPERPEWKAAGRLWQGIPGIERTANGRLYACWYSGGKTEEPGNIVILEKSDDDGQTWTDGFCVVCHDDPEVRCFDEAIWIDPRGRLWLFWTQSRLFYDGRNGVWCAVCEQPDAEEVAFSRPRRLFDGLMLNKPIAASDGTWYFPAALWSVSVSKPLEEHPELDSRRLAGVYASIDAGETFEWRGGADVPGRGFDEHMLVELKDGRLWTLVRATYGIGQAFSPDGGRTWTDAGPSGHTGPNSRFFIRRLASGRLLLVNHINPTYATNPRNWNTRNNLMAMLSEDDGKTWKGGLMLDTRDEISYPDGAQAAGGDIYLIYDYSRYGRRQILMAVFSEEDILAGRLVSANGRLKQLVSQATGKKEEEKR